jgi:hypothetical protein
LVLEVAVAAGVVTEIATAPAPAGAIAVIDVSLSTVKDVAAVEPKSTAVAPVNPDPVIVTEVPPAPGPDPGEKRETVGTGDAQMAVELITPPAVLVSSTLQLLLLAASVPLKGPDAVGFLPMPPPPTTSSPVGHEEVTTPAVELWV